MPWAGTPCDASQHSTAWHCTAPKCEDAADHHSLPHADKRHLAGLGGGLNEFLPQRKHLLAEAVNHCLAVTLMHGK